MKLYTYAKSSAAYRVRIALNLKSVAYEPHYIHLLKNGGENFTSHYRQINPQQLIPTLQVTDTYLHQSLAIIEYLEETHPVPPLLPGNSYQRATIRGLALMIACEIHPLNNLRVLNYLKSRLQITDEQKLTWYQHWIAEGFDAIEKKLSEHSNTGKYCMGDTPTMADVFLVPQVYNALRYNCNLSAYPVISRIYNSCLDHPAFKQASPENQADFEP